MQIGQKDVNGETTTQGTQQDSSPQQESPETQGSEGAEEALKQPISSAEGEVSELKDRLLRALAENENIRRRTAREKEEAVKYAISRFARDIVTVADNLQRALESMGEEERTSLTGTLKTLLEGVEMTNKQMLSIFEQHGIVKIAPLGEKFDHAFHQAMFEVEAAGQPTGTVVQVLQPGYALHDRLLRPALVGVAKEQTASPAKDPSERSVAEE